ncbi:unnamed protein product, partial [Phyllotreta striolata]
MAKRPWILDGNKTKCPEIAMASSGAARVRSVAFHVGAAAQGTRGRIADGHQAQQRRYLHLCGCTDGEVHTGDLRRYEQRYRHGDLQSGYVHMPVPSSSAGLQRGSPYLRRRHSRMRISALRWWFD